MFILTKIADLVQITPAEFHKKSVHAVEDNINAKYANKKEAPLTILATKVIQKIGLCICLYDLLWASEGLISQGTGSANVNAEFRLVVFRPFKGEVIMGRITKCTPGGIHVRTEFFSDIVVEAEELPEGCEFDHNEQLWVWNNEETGPMYWDIHETVRLAVIGEEWHDQTPTKPASAPGDEVQAQEEVKPPYVIKGTMKMPGLGCTLWWEF